MFGVIPALSRNPESLQEVNNTAQVRSWIPACAGKTTTPRPITSIAMIYKVVSSNRLVKLEAGGILTTAGEVPAFAGTTNRTLGNFHLQFDYNP